jgi:hypothetical protein
MREGEWRPGDARSGPEGVAAEQRSVPLARIEDAVSIRRARRVGLLLIAASALLMLGLMGAGWVMLMRLF